MPSRANGGCSPTRLWLYLVIVIYITEPQLHGAEGKTLAQLHVERICDDCLCRQLTKLECEGNQGRNLDCKWSRFAAECRHDLLAATPVPEMVQCDPNGLCKKCIDVNSTDQCGYKMYTEQRVNCTWDKEKEKKGGGCTTMQTEIDYQIQLIVKEAREGYVNTVQEFESRCTSWRVEEGANCTADPQCYFKFSKYAPMSSTCLTAAGRVNHTKFYIDDGGLGYKQGWIDQQEACMYPFTQYECKQAGCDWESRQCGLSAKTQCKLECNITVPGRLEYAYVRELETQCGEPCDSLDSEVAAGSQVGEDGQRLAYDISRRDYAERECGFQCMQASRCGGFDVDDDTGRCNYRRNTKCYTRRNSNRDCFTRKAQCSSLQCPLGYLPVPEEQESFCYGLTCTDFDTGTCCKLARCEDWENWYSGVDCKTNGYSLHHGCTPLGWTCKAYDVWDWCQTSPIGIARGVPTPGAEWSLGEENGFPERHCCMCGGGKEVLPDAATRIQPPVLHKYAKAPPEQHVCCIGLNVGEEWIRATVPEELNHTAIEKVKCVRELGEEPLAPSTKAGAVCQFCMCLAADGGDFFKQPQCCSVRHFANPGTDPLSDLPYCTRYLPQYNLADESARACELRYDLYPFAVGGAASKVPWLGVIASLAITALGSLEYSVP